MSDNRTSEPTKAMIEAATEAMEDYYDRWSGPGEQSPTYAEFAEVALVAAQGAAPQAESDELASPSLAVYDKGRKYGFQFTSLQSAEIAEAAVQEYLKEPDAAPQSGSAPTSSYINPALPGMIRNLWKSDPSENSVRTSLKLAGDLIQELIDLRAAPVLPSSTVDESNSPTLAVIAKAREFDLSVGMTAAAHMADAAIGASGLRVDLAAPVLPSSGVDEDKLRNVVRVAKNDWLRRCGQPGHTEDIDVWITRAVATWLKGQGGESRGDC